MSVQSASTPVQSIISANPNYLRAKRILDVVFTLLILIPLCIIVAIIAVLIRLDSKGPIFFRQKRIGQNGDEFVMLKFRSMHVESDDAPHRDAFNEYMNARTDNAVLHKLSDDPRITKVGKYIRKFSIDELPQFFNILRGEMTLVGPRPPLSYEIELYSPNDRLRLTGKPGLTGNWQVYGRSRVTFHEMVEMDIAYLQQQSILQDLKLIILTIPVMVSGRGGG